MQPLSTGIRWWFESLDQARRQRGVAMDRLGYGPRESTSWIVLSVPGLRLRCYNDGNTDDDRPVVLIVPAPIKRHYIWDMSPECSVVQHALKQGMRVYLIEWEDPDGPTSQFGLQEYGYTLIDQCVEAIHPGEPEKKVFLLAHSLGGVLATIYAARRGERVAGMALIETPLHFGKDSGSFAPLVAFGPPADRVTQVFERVPGSVLSMVSSAASPTTFNAERYADFIASLGSSRHMKNHIQVERWTLDEAPMAGALFEQVVEELYRKDSLMCGKLFIRGRHIGPRSLSSPLLSVYDPHSVVIPPASVIAFHDAAASRTKQLLRYEGDTGVALAHVGGLMGENAHRHLWPQIFAWLHVLNAVRH
ncbi:MAG TPA: alpha/beta fold hydrolase [Noviherbaspirillum sp.]|nr:alpha/beta fold hydrolase [Noviherbaspirillum sp.]